jgi:hypothetical protein
VADGTGGHAFAVTLEEHNRNVRKWREIAGNAAAAAAEAAPATEEVPVPAPAAAAAEGPLAAVTETVETTAPAAPVPGAAEAVEAPRAKLAPGTIVMVEGRQAVIPRLRPAR